MRLLELGTPWYPFISIKPFENCRFIFLHFYFSNVTISSPRLTLIIKLHAQDVLNLPTLFRIKSQFLFWPYRKLFGLYWTKCVPYCTCFYLKITPSLKIHEKIVKTDQKQNPLKSIAENDSSLLQCIWIVCTTPELVCGRGGLRYRNTLYVISFSEPCFSAI